MRAEKERKDGIGENPNQTAFHQHLQSSDNEWPECHKKLWLDRHKKIHQFWEQCWPACVLVGMDSKPLKITPYMQEFTVPPYTSHSFFNVSLRLAGFPYVILLLPYGAVKYNSFCINLYAKNSLISWRITVQSPQCE